MSERQSSKLVDSVSNYVEEQLRNHFAERAAYVKNHELRVEIKRLFFDSLTASLKVEVAGTLNEKPVRWRFYAYRRGAGAVPGGLALYLAASTVASAVDAVTGNPSTAKKVAACAEEIVARLVVKIDRILNVPPTPVELRWNKLRQCRWVGGLLLLLVLVAWIDAAPEGLSLAHHPWHTRLIPATVFSCLPTGIFLIVAYCASILVMPGEFFETARGREAIAMSGARTVVSFRILCVTLILALVAGFAALIYLLLGLRALFISLTIDLVIAIAGIVCIKTTAKVGNP